MAELIFTVGADTSEAASQLKSFLSDYSAGAKQAGATADAALGGTIDKEIRLEVIGGDKVSAAYKQAGQYANQQVAAQKAINGELGKTKSQLLAQLGGLKNAASNTQIWADNSKKLTTEFKTVQAAIAKVEGELNKISGPDWFSGIRKNLSATLIASNLFTAAIQAAAGAMKMLLSEGMRMETLRLQLEAFTGSAENAERAMTEFVDIAVKTPFNVQQVAEAGKIMMGFGVEVDKAVDSTRSLAMAASASGGQLDNMARNLGQIASQGRAYTRDLTQFAIQGVPIWEKLSEVTGESTVALKKMAEEGKIGFTEVGAALKNLTQLGSEFYILAQEMEKSMQGQFEALVGEVQRFAGGIAEAFTKMNEQTGLIDLFFDAAKAGIQAVGVLLKGLIENMGTVIKVAGAAGAAMLAWKAVSSGGAILKFMEALIKLYQTAVGLLKTRIALNVALKALIAGWNPAALAVGVAQVGAAVGAAALAYAALDTAMGAAAEKAKAAQTQNEALKKVYEEEKAALEELKTKMNEKDAILQSIESRLARYRELLEKNVITQKQFNEAVGGLKIELEALAPKADEAGAKVDQLEEKIRLLREQLVTLKDQKIIDDRATEDAIENLNRIKQAEKDRHDLVKGNIDTEKTAAKAKYDAMKNALQDAKDFEDRRHEAAMSNLDREIEKVEQLLSEKLAALDEEAAAIEATLQSDLAASDALARKEAVLHEQKMSYIDQEYQSKLQLLTLDDQRIGNIKAQLADLQGQTAAQKRLAQFASETAGKELTQLDIMKKRHLESIAQMETEQKARQERILKAELMREEEERARKLAQIEEEKAAAEKKAQEEYKKQQQDRIAFNETLKQQAADRLADAEKEREEEEKAAEKRIEALEAEQAQEEENHKNNKIILEEREKTESRMHKSVMAAIQARMKAEDELHKRNIRNIQDEIEAEKRAKKERDRAYEDKTRAIQKLITKTQEQIREQKDATRAIDEGAEAVEGFGDRYDYVHSQIRQAIALQDTLNQKIAQGQRAKGRVKAPDLPYMRASGGPVKGGATYTVNELGKEAFLSASGQLSMINAPSWGKWRAPGAGTVIPAHLTSKLDIPRNGINLNASASASAIKASRGGDTSLAGALARLSAAGDTISNNVTIQSANPNKTASDMLVELTKIRHRRYRR